MQYGCILADPPWPMSGGKNGKGGWSNKVSPSAHYGLMKVGDICKLPVRELASPDAHLYLWVLNGMLQEGLQVMKAWNFRYVTNICWEKTTGYGPGQYFRNMHELVLFGVRGKVPYSRDAAGKRVQFRSVFKAPRTRHSEKPESLRTMIESISPGPRLELFARKNVPGWHAWGNEVQSDISLVIP